MHEVLTVQAISRRHKVRDALNYQPLRFFNRHLRHYHPDHILTNFPTILERSRTFQERDIDPDFNICLFQYLNAESVRPSETDDEPRHRLRAEEIGQP